MPRARASGGRARGGLLGSREKGERSRGQSPAYAEDKVGSRRRWVLGGPGATSRGPAAPLFPRRWGPRSRPGPPPRAGELGPRAEGRRRLPGGTKAAVSAGSLRTTHRAPEPSRSLEGALFLTQKKRKKPLRYCCYLLCRCPCLPEYFPSKILGVG